jgi:hypothetical protein
VLITITGAGETLKERAKRVPKQIAACVNLTPDETDTLYHLLYKLLDNSDNTSISDISDNGIHTRNSDISDNDSHTRNSDNSNETTENKRTRNSDNSIAIKNKRTRNSDIEAGEPA